MIDILLSPSDNLCGRDGLSTARTTSTKLPIKRKTKKYTFVGNKTKKEKPQKVTTTNTNCENLMRYLNLLVFGIYGSQVKKEAYSNSKYMKSYTLRYPLLIAAWTKAHAHQNDIITLTGNWTTHACGDTFVRQLNSEHMPLGVLRYYNFFISF